MGPKRIPPPPVVGKRDPIAHHGILRIHIHYGTDRRMQTIDRLFESSPLTVDELAAAANLDRDRVEAILDGRWLPSPHERDRIARVFEVPAEEISWGHSMNPRNVRYHRFGLPEDFGEGIGG